MKGSSASPVPKDALSLQRALEQEALQLQLEMDRIKARREQLDQQRAFLQRQSNRLGISPITNVSGERSSAPRSASRRSASAGPRPRAFGSYDIIPSEHERRGSECVTQERVMKERIKESWEEDSSLIGGYFLLKDTKSVPTITRDRRFKPLIGVPGQYWLAHDVTVMQKQAKAKRHPIFSVSNRGGVGTNVSTHWNDSKGGTAPGPGTYTPRFQKAAPPSILARRF